MTSNSYSKHGDPENHTSHESSTRFRIGLHNTEAHVEEILHRHLQNVSLQCQHRLKQQQTLTLTQMQKTF